MYVRGGPTGDHAFEAYMPFCGKEKGVKVHDFKGEENSLQGVGITHVWKTDVCYAMQTQWDQRGL